MSPTLTTVVPVSGVHAVFVPGDPPRAGYLALWPPPDRPGDRIRIELAVPAGTTVRRRTVDAFRMPLPDAIAWLADPPSDPEPSLSAWLVAARLGMQLIARGRLLPAATPSGWDAVAGRPPRPGRPVTVLAELAAAFPPDAHALPIPRLRAPLRIRSAEIAHPRRSGTRLADALGPQPGGSHDDGRPGVVRRHRPDRRRARWPTGWPPPTAPSTPAPGRGCAWSCP